MSAMSVGLVRTRAWRGAGWWRRAAARAVFVVLRANRSLGAVEASEVDDGQGVDRPALAVLIRDWLCSIIVYEWVPIYLVHRGTRGCAQKI